MRHSHKLRPIALACMAAASGAAFAQAAPAADPTLPEVKVRDATAGADYNPATSSIGGGIDTPLRDIPQSAFHVLEDGHSQAITHFASVAQYPRHVLLPPNRSR
jgi:outer membrane receptor for ferric coprogen and ferric-rhodotorulic acid